jgi:hypothetical protein
VLHVLYLLSLSHEYHITTVFYELATQKEDDSYDSAPTAAPRIFFERQSIEETELLDSSDADIPNGSAPP